MGKVRRNCWEFLQTQLQHTKSLCGGNILTFCKYLNILRNTSQNKTFEAFTLQSKLCFLRSSASFCFINSLRNTSQNKTFESFTFHLKLCFPHSLEFLLLRQQKFPISQEIFYMFIVLINWIFSGWFL